MKSSKAEILEKAAECFMEQGFHATTIDDVARRLGSTKGRIYHHYASKTDLFFDVHREGMRRLFAAVEPVQQASGDAFSVLVALLRAHARAMLDNHVFEGVVAQGVQLHRFGATTPDQRRVLDELIASRDAFEAIFKRQAIAAQAEGHLSGLDVSIAVKAMLGALQWSVIWYRPERDRGRNARESLAERMVAAIVNGLMKR